MTTTETRPAGPHILLAIVLAIGAAAVATRVWQIGQMLVAAEQQVTTSVAQ
jgi:hypothetical protein